MPAPLPCILSIYKGKTSYTLWGQKVILPSLTKLCKVKIEFQTLHSRPEKPLSARGFDNTTRTFGILILLVLMMKMKSIGIKQLYPVSKPSKWQEAGFKARSV